MATITITQSFNANGGTFGTSTDWADQTQTVEEGGSATFTIPKDGPTRSGYLFIGWSSNSWATTPYINVSTSEQTVVLTKDRIWYAVWWKTPLIEHFDANGGTFNTSAWADQSVSRTYSGPSDINKTVTFTIPANGPTKFGYIFRGWSVSQYSDIPEYEAKTTQQSFTSTTDKNWYAVWEKIPVYIKKNGYILKAYTYMKRNNEIHDVSFYKNGMS